MVLMMTGAFAVSADQNSLAKLTDLAGASGFEKSVRDVVKQ